MTTAKARELVGKLLALADPTRGGTPAECALAQEKADALIAKFDLGRVSVADETPPREFTDFVFNVGEAWFFDPRSGRSSQNVIVHRFNSRRDWKIEVPPPAPRPGFRG